MTNKNNITVLKVGTDTMINEQGLVRKNILSSKIYKLNITKSQAETLIRHKAKADF